MGRATLLLTLAAAALAGPSGAAAPPPAVNARAAARFEEMVAAGRKEQSELTVLLDELATLASSYDWESDAGRAAQRRTDLLKRVSALVSAFKERLNGIGGALRRFGDEHGLETLERLADEKSAGSPDIVSIMRAQTFHAQGLLFVARVEHDMRFEEDAWRRFQMIEGERRRFRRTVWTFALLFAAALAAAAYAVRSARRRRRGPPATDPRLRGHRKGDIIDLKPE